MKYLFAFVSPVLAYFSYYGSVGATNLLYGWTIFGVGMAILLMLMAGLIALAAALISDKDKDKHQVNIEKARQSFLKLRSVSFFTVMDIVCVCFYVWVGWWVLAVMEFFQLAILKTVAYLTPENEE